MAPELPNRDIQRELVYQQTKDPVSRELLRSSIPNNKAYEYRLSNKEGYQFGQKLIELVRRERGNAIRGILGIAATAQNPAQLSNALGAFSILEHQIGASNNADKAKLFDQAQDEFLKSATETPFASDGARSLQAQMIGIWNEVQGQTAWSTPEDKQWRTISLVHHLQDEVCKGSKADEKGQSKYWAEAYLLTVLDPHTPFGLRKILLSMSIHLDFGVLTYHASVYDSSDPRFRGDASVLRSANASWVYPEILGVPKGSGDMKDWEIAGLRKTVADLQQQLDQGSRPGMTNEQERLQLRGLISRLQKAVQENEEKLKIYKEIGQHPLDALRIGYQTWKSVSPDARKELILRAYRENAKKYHYQVPPSEPSFNPLLQELANKEFTRLTNAYKYLNTHTDQAEF